MKTLLGYVLRFEEIGKSSLPVVGGKNASLGELTKAGFRVPPGFAVTTSSYLKFITATGIKDVMREILSTVRLDDAVHHTYVGGIYELSDIPRHDR